MKHVKGTRDISSVNFSEYFSFVLWTITIVFFDSFKRFLNVRNSLTPSNTVYVFIHRMLLTIYEYNNRIRILTQKWTGNCLHNHNLVRKVVSAFEKFKSVNPWMVLVKCYHKCFPTAFFNWMRFRRDRFQVSLFGTKNILYYVYE